MKSTLILPAGWLNMNKKRILLFLFLLTGCAANRVIYPVSPSYEKIYFAKTEDGWQLAVYHYPPKGVPQGKPPVVLCHGLNQNYLFWDLTPEWSFARVLSEKGFDVWSVSLRGSGRSTKPGWAQFLELNQLSPELLEQHQYDIRKFNWNMDDYILKDLPVLIDFVKQKTGYSTLSWIGHSMGGMAMAAYLGLNPDPSIENLILIGVPGKINDPKTDLLQDIIKQEPLLKMSLFINTRNLTNLTAPISDQLHGPLQILSYNTQNMTKEILARFNTHVIENTSPGVVTQMKLMVQKGDFYSSDQSRNYTAQYHKIQAHLLCVAGKLDNLATPSSAHFIYNAASSQDKTYRLFGVANGYSADYGHNDLILGKKAPEEVYPYIIGWLEQH